MPSAIKVCCVLNAFVIWQFKTAKYAPGYLAFCASFHKLKTTNIQSSNFKHYDFQLAYCLLMAANISPGRRRFWFIAVHGCGRILEPISYRSKFRRVFLHFRCRKLSRNFPLLRNSAKHEVDSEERSLRRAMVLFKFNVTTEIVIISFHWLNRQKCDPATLIQIWSDFRKT